MYAWGRVITFKLESPSGAEEEAECKALADGRVCGPGGRIHAAVAW